MTIKPATPLPCGPLPRDRKDAISSVRARLERLEYLANTADDTDEYCRLLDKQQQARALLREMGEIT